MAQPHQYGKHFVDRQIVPHLAPFPLLRNVFAKLGRERFITDIPLSVAYSDALLKTSQDRFLLPPLMLAKIFHHLTPNADDSAMVVAGGGGYTAGILSFLCATVFLFETDEISLKSIYTIYDQCNINNVVPIQGKLREGLSKQGPFDWILFDVGVDVVPQFFFNQLKDKGKLIVCVIKGPNFGEITCFSKTGLTVEKTVLFEGYIPTIPHFNESVEFTF